MSYSLPADVLSGFVADAPSASATGARRWIRMAMSGQMMAQDRHAVQRDSSKQVAYGSPCLLKESRDMVRIFSGQAPMHSVQPLHRSRSNSGLPLDTEVLLYHDVRSA
jgi:hypothetical protein